MQSVLCTLFSVRERLFAIPLSQFLIFRVFIFMGNINIQTFADKRLRLMLNMHHIAFSYSAVKNYFSQGIIFCVNIATDCDVCKSMKKNFFYFNIKKSKPYACYASIKILSSVLWSTFFSLLVYFMGIFVSNFHSFASRDDRHKYLYSPALAVVFYHLKQ